jgi:hypothetical protein
VGGQGTAVPIQSALITVQDSTRFAHCCNTFQALLACIAGHVPAATNHEHDQPPHLKLKDPGVPEYLNGPHYAAPESRYCPAGEGSRGSVCIWLTGDLSGKMVNIKLEQQGLQ